MTPLLLLVALSSAPGAPAVWSAPRHEVFGSEREGWVLLEVQTRAVRHLDFPAPYKPTNVACTADGRLVVFTAYDLGARNDLLFAWEPGGPAPPRRIGDVRGYHADPIIGPDQWVYFAHHPNAGGPPGQHAEKAYAQLYRVRLDGSGLELLTGEVGCHFSPTGGRKAVYLIHTLCKLSRDVVRLDLETRASTILTSRGGMYDEPSLSPDGQHLLFSGGAFETALLQELDLSTRKVRLVKSVERDGSGHLRPRYGKSPTELYYQTLGQVWCFDGTKASPIARMGRDNPTPPSPR